MSSSLIRCCHCDQQIVFEIVQCDNILFLGISSENQPKQDLLQEEDEEGSLRSYLS
jgi:hypothetical protein